MKKYKTSEVDSSKGLMNFATKIGLNKVFWDKFLKENGALDKCLYRPSLEGKN